MPASADRMQIVTDNDDDAISTLLTLFTDIKAVLIEIRDDQRELHETQNGKKGVKGIALEGII